MYLEGKWYSLTAKTGTYNDNDPIGVLDVTILTNQILSPILDIQDLQKIENGLILLEEFVAWVNLKRELIAEK